MRKLSVCRNMVIGLVILVISIASVWSSPLFGEEKYVSVTLRDDTVLKLQYDSFSIHWVEPKIKDEFTCEEYAFTVNDLVEIWTLNPGLNSCDHREDEWIFEVTLKGMNPLQGFIQVTAEEITGKLFETGEVKTYPFQEVRKISYH